MKEIISRLNVVLAGVGGVLGWFCGGLDASLYALIAFVVADYATGVLSAAVRRELSSEVGFHGIAKKVCIFILVGIANIIDTDIIGGGSAVRGAVIGFMMANEGLSCIENAALIGIPIPKKLRQVLAQLSNDEETGTDTGTGADSDSE
ncbi:MAG: phage holin family protein [Firmicutes bacterium]|nr:phage holin family protein [Bacillota bacterium]